MWPLGMPGRSSGAVPWKRGAARASSTTRPGSGVIMSPMPRRRVARKVAWKRAGAGGSGAPFRQAAVQNGGVVVTEQAHQPPAAGRGGDAFLVVEDDAAGVGDAHLAHQPLEAASGRDHVRQGGFLVGDEVDIEVAGAG